jgi:WD40 repeat protein
LIHSIAVKPDGTSVLLTTAENALYRIDLASPDRPRFLAQYRNAPRHVAYSPDGSKYSVAVGTYPWEPDPIDVHDSATDKVLHTIKPPGFVTALSFTPDSTGLVTSGSHHAVALYNAATGGELYRTAWKHPSDVSHALAPDGKSAALCDRFARRAVLLNLDTGNEIRAWDTLQDVVPRGCAYDPRGRLLAIGDWTHAIQLWDTQTGNSVRTFAGHGAALTGVRFTPDGSALVSTSRDGTLRVWNPDAARAKSVVTVGPENQHCCFALDRSGRYAFVASHGGFVSVLKLP